MPRSERFGRGPRFGRQQRGGFGGFGVEVSGACLGGF